ncbi:MAG: hypothetical protein IJP03_03960 [Christensenellaceae bacterium]|nr:hypothetical protein [Christensenellaceae bacterium]
MNICKKAALALAMLLIIAALLACAPQIPTAPVLEKPAIDEEDFPMELTFSSNVFWSTTITLKQDGSFTGIYKDVEAEDADTDYPGGTVYTCEFSGSFSQMTPNINGTWSLTLGQVKCKKEKGEKWIEDSVRYVSDIPFGLEEGSGEFLLYPAGTPTEDLSIDLLQWMQYEGDELPEELPGNCLYNQKLKYAFFTEAA